MRTDDLDYELPPGAVAQHPAEPRDAARLLVDRGPGRDPSHLRIRDLPGLVRPGDVVVLNDTRVLPARVPVARASGGSGEVLLLEERDGGWWECLCRPARKLAPGEVVTAVQGRLRLEVGADLGGGRRLVRPLTQGPLAEELEASGEVPLPPYITAPLADPERYQTVYAARPASAAAPTAGLHLTAAVLAGVEAAGATLARVELVVGLDTFRPVTTDRVEDHVIHTERYEVPAGTRKAVRAARSGGGRVFAVGTTTVRALESAAHRDEAAGRTDLFITPGFEFGVVDVLLTNFHLPRSSLLAMIEAFIGPRWRDLYATALSRGYRFLSFGDAMLLERTGTPTPPSRGGSVLRTSCGTAASASQNDVGGGRGDDGDGQVERA